MARYETHVRDGMTFTTDNGPSGPHDMTDKELRDNLRCIRPNNAVQMDFKDMLTRYGGTLAEVRKRKMHVIAGEMFNEDEQWQSYIEKQTGQKIGYIELFEAGIEVLNHPEKARVVVTVGDVVEAGRKALADKLAEAPKLAEDDERDEKTGRFIRIDKTENVNVGHNGGNSAAYRLAKIARDHPELAKRIEDGEFTLVSQAERAIGLRPPKMSDLERFQRAYFRLSFVDQAAAKVWFASL